MTDKHKPQRQYSREVTINAPKDAVWKALTDAIELRQWFAPQARIDKTPGGTVEWQWTDEIVWPQTIQTFEAGERLVTRYDFPFKDSAEGKVPLFIDFQLQNEGGGTRLRLIHSGFGPQADFDQEYDGISHGWTIELHSLQLYLEKHLGQRRQLSWVQANFSTDADKAWQTLTGPDGLNCSNNIRGLTSGDRFNFTTAAGDQFSGSVLENQPRGFIGIAENWNNSFLRIQVETCGGSEQVWLWHAAWGIEQTQVDGLTRRWQTMVKHLFGDDALVDHQPLQQASA